MKEEELAFWRQLEGLSDPTGDTPEMPPQGQGKPNSRSLRREAGGSWKQTSMTATLRPARPQSATIRSPPLSKGIIATISYRNLKQRE